MKEIEVNVIDLDALEHGDRTIKKVVEKIPDDKVREHDLCTLCGNIGYPACKEVCQGYEFMLKQLAKNQQ